MTINTDTHDHGSFIGQTLYSSDNEKVGKMTASTGLKT